MTAAQQISRIDQQIDLIRTELKSRERIDRSSAESWQSAWDKHPVLHAEEIELFRQRGRLQLERGKS